MHTENRRKAVDRARMAGWTHRSIGKEIGTTGANLGEILKRKSSRSQYAHALDAWLQEMGFWEASAPIEVTGNMFSIVADELRVLAKAFDNIEVPAKVKVERMKALFNSYIPTLDDLVN